jgi:hypothetical protein
MQAGIWIEFSGRLRTHIDDSGDAAIAAARRAGENEPMAKDARIKNEERANEELSDFRRLPVKSDAAS